MYLNATIQHMWITTLLDKYNPLDNTQLCEIGHCDALLWISLSDLALALWEITSDQQTATSTQRT